MNFTTNDGKRLCSFLCNQEKLLNKKRRWLQGPQTIASSKESKRPKFLTNLFLAESRLRTDEVSAEYIRTEVEKSFGSCSDTQGKHHIVQDHVQLHFSNVESDSNVQSNLLKNFYCALDQLNNRALFLIASLVTDNKVKFDKTRPRMKEIIRDYLPEVLDGASHKNYRIQLKQISQVFSDPINFMEKKLKLSTPVCFSLLSSVHDTLEGLDEMPLVDIVAMNRKLRGETIVPQFPPIIVGRTRDLLIKRVRKRCQFFLSDLKEGADMPEPFAKALSVMRLSLKHKTRCVDVSTSEFYPFAPETVSMQNDILKALWSLPSVRMSELKSLHPLVDPDGKISMRSFRNSLKTYLMEYLFECDVVQLPEEVLSVLTCLNRRSRRKPILYSSGMIDEEVEGVLNVSCLLKQVVSNLVPDNTDDETSETFGFESEINDFKLDETDYCSTSAEHKQMNDSSCFNEGEGTTGDSWTSADTCEVGESEDLRLTEACADDVVLKKCKLKKNDMNSTRENAIQELCDETSLVAYKLIGNMLDKFLQQEGRHVDEMSRYYLLRGSSSSPHSQDAEDSSSLDENARADIFVQAVEKLLPSLPKSCIEKAKKLMHES